MGPIDELRKIRIPMNPGDNNTLPDNDWSSATHKLVNSEGPGIPFDTLKTGDVILVKTRNTLYQLRWLGDNRVEISSNKPNRPNGQVTIIGCALGAGSSVAMNRLFCGGGLEYSSDGGKLTHRTSTIVELILNQR